MAKSFAPRATPTRKVLNRVQIDSAGLSGDFYVGDPSFLFQSDDQWKEFTSIVDTGHTLITYNGLQLALFNTHVDGCYLVYEQIDGEYQQIDAIPIETAIIVVAPVELATAEQKVLRENGIILSSNNQIICGYDLDDRGISSIRVGSLYIPVDPDLQDELIYRDEKRAEEAEQSKREKEMAQALEKRNKKRKNASKYLPLEMRWRARLTFSWPDLITIPGTPIPVRQPIVTELPPILHPPATSISPDMPPSSRHLRRI